MAGKRFGIIALICATLIFTMACSKNENASDSSNSSSASGSSKTSTGATTGPSPTEALKSYYLAASKKDFATAKQYLSKSALAEMEKSGQKKGQTLEAVMTESTSGYSEGNMPSLHNEKISGDTATVDLLPDGSVKMSFVKEDGKWKIEMDKFMKERMG